MKLGLDPFVKTETFLFGPFNITIDRLKEIYFSIYIDFGQTNFYCIKKKVCVKQTREIERG